MTAVMDRKADYSTFPSLNKQQARMAAAQLVAMRGEGRAVEDVILGRVERFYRREARLLDEERYGEWYELLADDLFYWMPMRENRYRRDERQEFDPDAMAFFDESKADIAVRIGRLNSGLAWTEDPATRHVFSVTNVEVFETPVSGEFETHHVFSQYRNRSEHDESTICGRRRDLIRVVEGGFQIVRRMIILPQSVLLAKNLSAFF